MRRSGIGTLAAVAGMVVILIVGAAAYFILDTGGSSPPLTSASSTSTSGASGAASSIAVSVTSSTVSASCSSLPSTSNASSIITPGVLAGYAALFGNFSEMSISLRTNSSLPALASSGPLTVVSSYQVVAASGSGPAEVYQVGVNEQVPGSTNQTLTAWVQANGTVNEVSFLGQNMTGSQATETFAGFMSAFTIESQEHDNITEIASSPSFRIVNQTTVTLGSSTLSVTNYEATPPLSTSECGASATISAYAVQTGTLAGSPYTLITYESVQASLQLSSGASNIGFTLKVLSVSK